DTIVRSPPRDHDTVMTPAKNNQEEIPVNNAGDPRDGEKGYPFTEEEDDVPVITERRAGKQPQFSQEIPVDKAQPIAQLTKSDIAEVLAALRNLLFRMIIVLIKF
ncbi:hypothetical protein A2U01_0064514, partial [Trifolium medium]|nr:hypothetical protein [Trifolium medium]